MQARRLRGLVAIVALIFLLTHPIATAGAFALTGQHDTSGDQTITYSYRIEWWHQPLGDHLRSILFTALPTEFLPVLALINPLLFYGIWSYLGYRRLSKRSILKHETRRTLCEVIRKNPGISAGDLIQMTGINKGTLEYHLSVLESAGVIVSKHIHGMTGYFATPDIPNELEQRVLLHLRKDTGRKILSVLLERRTIERKDLTLLLGISGSATSWHMQRLASDGIVDVHRDGRTTRYLLGHEAAPFVRIFLAEPFAGEPAEAAGGRTAVSCLQEKSTG